MRIGEKLKSVTLLTGSQNLKVFAAYFCGTFLVASLGVWIFSTEWHRYKQFQACEFSLIFSREVDELHKLTAELPLTSENSLFLSELMYKTVVQPRQSFHRTLLEEMSNSPIVFIPPEADINSLVIYLAELEKQKTAITKCQPAEMDKLESRLMKRLKNSAWFLALVDLQTHLTESWARSLVKNQSLVPELIEDMNRDRKLLCYTKKNLGDSLSLQNVMNQQCKGGTYACENYLEKMKTQTRDLASVEETNTSKFSKKWGRSRLALQKCD
jgi:hypothetical protein